MNVKLSSTFFLKIVTFLIGIAVLAVCVYWLPQAAIRDAKVRPGDYSIYPLLLCLRSMHYVFCCDVSSIQTIELYQSKHCFF